MTAKERLAKEVDVLKSEYRGKIPSHKELVDAYINTQVSRKYNVAKKRANVDCHVIWGIGGVQSARIREYEKKNEKYIVMINNVDMEENND